MIGTQGKRLTKLTFLHIVKTVQGNLLFSTLALGCIHPTNTLSAALNTAPNGA
jgi:hypothetical protein